MKRRRHGGSTAHEHQRHHHHELVESAVETALDNARAKFEQLGILATDNAVAVAALDDPVIEALMNDEAATEFVGMQAIDEIIAGIPPRDAGESRRAYHERAAAAVRAKLQPREDAYRRLGLLRPRPRRRKGTSKN